MVFRTGDLFFFQLEKQDFFAYLFSMVTSEIATDFDLVVT